MNETPRIDLATTIHKAVRKVLFDHALRLARADFRDAEECRRVHAETTEVLAALDEHAGHEDRVILPAVARHAPALSESMQTQHVDLEHRMQAIARLAGLATIVTPSERAVIGRQLRAAFEDLVAAQLVHLAIEETDVNAVLWAHYTDGELAAMSGAIRGSLSPSRGHFWLELLRGSVDPTERALLGLP